MCGIAGIFHYSDPERAADPELLVRMTRRIAHRGPDAEDFWFGTGAESGVAFGHRRLSIVDLSPTGAQPMASDDGRCRITYNGEFYNHADFRNSLGGPWRGTSDTETMLRLMERKGPEALKNTSGIFAFGFWDSRDHALTLVRDHMGVKQVYYHDDGRRILFASEIKALLEDPSVPREPDAEAINQYLHFHTALYERTFLRHVKVVPAGHFLRITRHGALLRRYWHLDDGHCAPGRDTERVEELRRELSEAVERQLMADVPVGSFFSGGIDSCTIAAKATEVGKKPLCFGVHFSGQRVTDERPYQEAAAKALGLDLRLITMDGSTFPEDMRRLMYHQEQPVIGSALFPMAKVSQLAAESVKVCLGGQAADELFGGYARYALGRPDQVLRSWFAGRRGRGPDAGTPAARSVSTVGGNLARQFASRANLVRLARNLRHLTHWESSYFEHFAKVPEESWRRLLDPPEFCSRENARRLFYEKVGQYRSADPVDKIMRWDVDTYLTGLFQQDDRMSMAASLESRVPFADPAVASFAFSVHADLKLRGGASKWILRQAVAPLLPPLVLNRRKVGFDTPAQHWMAEVHPGFVRETLLSARARQRGFWNASEIERLLGAPGSPLWVDIMWKTLAIETWASLFLDGDADYSYERRPVERPVAHAIKPAHLLREFREMGWNGTVSRSWWELKTRSGLVSVPVAETPPPPDLKFPVRGAAQLPFTEARRMAGLFSPVGLPEAAAAATRGRIVAFSKWPADYGNPIDWHRDPTDGHRWNANAHWSRVLARSGAAEVKFTWEAARFPHAYTMARAAAANPAAAADLGAAFADQVAGFLDNNPPGKGVHWFSGQEVALRMMAFLFGWDVFSKLGVWPQELTERLGRHIYSCGAHLAAHIAYARDSVYNNHLLSESLGLFVAGSLLPGIAPVSWLGDGVNILTEQADRQFYRDGAYIQQSHNYQRGSLQLYLWAWALQRANGIEAPPEWRAAIERSLDFLVAHQNPEDGTLPNYGANDGSRPLPLSTGNYCDFRPVMQAASIAVRNERIYEPGPWDELPAWLLGPASLELPLRPPVRKSVSFAFTGYHVLRGTDPANFGAFRCGTIRDRFSQIDMLHLDVWWHGRNVLADGGSYRYNGAPRWHNYFKRTASHNTVELDGQDQMVHFRQFKTIYWTEAELLRFEDAGAWALVEGEHYGYSRVSRCTHRRAVLFLKEELWVVVDTILGPAGSAHSARLHWLAGVFPFAFDHSDARLTLTTPAGEFCVTLLDAAGSPLPGADVVAGALEPPRGWVAKYYGEREPTASLAVTRTGEVPLCFVSVLSAGRPDVAWQNGEWSVGAAGKSVRFRLKDGRFEGIAL